MAMIMENNKPQETKIKVSKFEYDYLHETSCQLMLIRTAMVEYMRAYSTTRRVYLDSEFLTILKILFPHDYERRECELLGELELLKEREEQEGGEA